MRILSLITSLFTAGPALAHGAHIETIGSHDHRLGIALAVAAGLGGLICATIRATKAVNDDD